MYLHLICAGAMPAPPARLLVLIMSHRLHHARRQASMQTWLNHVWFESDSQHNISSFWRFLIVEGRTADSPPESLDRIHNNVVVLSSVTEGYMHLRNKTFEALRFVINHVDFRWDVVLKADDDLLVNVARVHKWVSWLPATQRAWIFAGRVAYHGPRYRFPSRARRDGNSVRELWYKTWYHLRLAEKIERCERMDPSCMWALDSSYSSDFWPPYCDGALGYLLGRDLTQRILQLNDEGLYHEVHLEDVGVGLMARAAGVMPRQAWDKYGSGLPSPEWGIVTLKNWGCGLRYSGSRPITRSCNDWRCRGTCQKMLLSTGARYRSDNANLSQNWAVLLGTGAANNTTVERIAEPRWPQAHKVLASIGFISEGPRARRAAFRSSWKRFDGVGGMNISQIFTLRFVLMRCRSQVLSDREICTPDPPNQVWMSPSARVVRSIHFWLSYAVQHLPESEFIGISFDNVWLHLADVERLLRAIPPDERPRALVGSFATVTLAKSVSGAYKPGYHHAPGLVRYNSSTYQTSVGVDTAKDPNASSLKVIGPFPYAKLPFIAFGHHAVSLLDGSRRYHRSAEVAQRQKVIRVDAWLGACLWQELSLRPRERPIAIFDITPDSHIFKVGRERKLDAKLSHWLNARAKRPGVADVTLLQEASDSFHCSNPVCWMSASALQLPSPFRWRNANSTQRKSSPTQFFSVSVATAKLVLSVCKDSDFLSNDPLAQLRILHVSTTFRFSSLSTSSHKFVHPQPASWWSGDCEQLSIARSPHERAFFNGSNFSGQGLLVSSPCSTKRWRNCSTPPAKSKLVFDSQLTTRTPFLIFSSTRSASTFFTKTLRQHPHIACFFELLNDKQYPRWLEARVNMSQIAAMTNLTVFIQRFWELVCPLTGACGFKILLEHLLNGNTAKTVPRMLRELLAGVHPPPRVIILYRRDKKAQYASLLKARRTGLWGFSEDEAIQQQICGRFERACHFHTDKDWKQNASQSGNLSVFLQHQAEWHQSIQEAAAEIGTPVLTITSESLRGGEISSVLSNVVDFLEVAEPCRRNRDTV